MMIDHSYEYVWSFLMIDKNNVSHGPYAKNEKVGSYTYPCHKIDRV